jgi:ABC-type dipeptide/oligopeptide/nickel transport system permease component
MLRFIVRRILAIPITLFVITAVLYGVIMLAPLEARARLYWPPEQKPFITPQQEQKLLERLVKQHGLDAPYPVQYFRWISNVVRGDWGWSPTLDRDVLEALLARTPATAELTLYSLLLLIPLGIASGVTAGWNRDRLSDRGFRVTAYVATSIPPFILGLVLLSIFYVGLRWFAPSRLGISTTLDLDASSFKTITGLLTVDGFLNGRSDVSLEALRHLVLPVVTLGMAHWATLGRVTRAAVIEEASKDYVVAARARGLAQRSIVWRHVLLNAAPPALASTALSAASLVTGVFVVEAVFDFPGVSELIINSMYGLAPDASMAMGFAVYSVLVVLLLMFVLDFIQALVNPWMREDVVQT